MAVALFAVQNRSCQVALVVTGGLGVAMLCVWSRAGGFIRVSVA